MTMTLAVCAVLLGSVPVASPNVEGLVVGERFSDGRGLAVLNSPDGRQRWFPLPTSFDEGQALAGIHAAMPEVDEISASPDGLWLAVVSSDHGHPELEIVDLPMLLSGRGWMVVVALDPYPGSLRAAGWRDGELVVRSEWPLERCRDGCVNVGGPDPDGERVFLISPRRSSLRPAVPDDFDADSERLLELDDDD